MKGRNRSSESAYRSHFNLERRHSAQDRPALRSFVPAASPVGRLVSIADIGLVHESGWQNRPLKTALTFYSNLPNSHVSGKRVQNVHSIIMLHVGKKDVAEYLLSKGASVKYALVNALQYQDLVFSFSFLCPQN